MADFQAAAQEIVERFDGHVAHNQGDELAVYFGYPRAHDDDAREGRGLIATGRSILESERIT